VAEPGHRTFVHLLPRFVGGGPERTILTFIAGMRSLGFDDRHTVLALERGLSPRLLMQSRQLGVELVRAPDDETVLHHVGRADLVHIHYWNHPALLSLLRRVELPSARVLVWVRVHGAAPPQMLTEELITLADVLLVTSASSLDLPAVASARRRGIPVEHIPSIMDVSRLAGPTRRPHRGTVVGYLGLVGHAKLHPRFAELCAQVRAPGVRFVVVGGGGGHDELRGELERAGLAHRTEVRAPTEDVASVLAEFDIFGYPLTPDTYASSDRALQEAMWVGVPPVLLPSAGMAWMVDHERTGLVADEAGYAAAIDRLATDADLRARLGTAARAHARAAFDPATSTKRYATIIDRALGSPRRARAPLPGSGEPAAQQFVRSLGTAAGPFATSLAGSNGDGTAEVTAADQLIGASSATLVGGEGGVVHHRNAYPDDPHLRLWSGLLAEAEGRWELAAAEYEAAAALGLIDGRPAAYRARCS
jgi:glycosyltransferase involved in cell wall biosynthesis